MTAKTENQVLSWWTTNTETFEPLMEHEVNGLDYKYVYGNDRLSVDISPINNSMSIVENGDHIRLYYHMDYLGSADYLTSPVSGRVEAWTHYNEWGLIVHNAVLKCGQRELDLVKRYATHDFDSVLEMYYAKARFYDAHDRRFTAVDPILDPSGYDLREYVKNPVQFVQYLYVEDSPLIYVDYLGMFLPGTILKEGASGNDISDLHDFLAKNGYLEYSQIQGYTSGDKMITYGQHTTKAIKAFQKSNGLPQTGTVDKETWKKMGFSVNETLAQEFWKGKKGNDTINIVIEGNNITINYSPRILVCTNIERPEKVFRHGVYFTSYAPCNQSVDDDLYQKYEERIVTGLKAWSKDNIQIQGVSGTVTVNVTPIKAKHRLDADIVFVTNKEGRGATLSAVGWTPGGAKGFEVPLGWRRYRDKEGNPTASVSNISAHEFGHVLGLMDLYPEWYNGHNEKRVSPDADVDLGVMGWNYYHELTFTNFDYEMMLYAWSIGRMQSYFKESELLATASQAFFRS